MPVLESFPENIVLENERVLLRPLSMDDHAYLLPFALNEPHIWKFSLISAAGVEGLRSYMKLAIDGRTEGKEYPFIIYDKYQEKYAGSTRFYDINLPFQTLQLGYTWYGKDFQGTGLNRHCKYLLLKYAFETLQMERVEFRADALNSRSIAAMKRIGCTVDGILRSNMPNRDGGRRDSIVLSILKEEWNSRIKEHLKELLEW